MAETTTPNFKWTKPDIGGDASTWGNVLNTTFDAIDAVAWATLNAGVPIGSIAMFGGAAAPPNWLICDGSSLATTGTYAGLFAAIQYAHGGSGANFNLPNLLGAFPLGAGAGSQINVGLGAVGGEANHVLAAGEMPAHAHGVSDPTHAHGAYQNAHSHVIVTGNHAHGITTGSHSHAIPLDLVNPSAGGLTNGGASFGLAGGQRTDTAGNLGGNTDTAGNLGGYTDTQQPGVGIDAAGTGIGIQNAGGGAGHNNMPPYVGVNFIIRFQ